LCQHLQHHFHQQLLAATSCWFISHTIISKPPIQPITCPCNNVAAGNKQ
jgi:hypothetical protein